jgi:hypothetical protein
VKLGLLGASLILGGLTCHVQHVSTDGDSHTRWVIISNPLLDEPVPSFVLDFDGDGEDDFWTEWGLFLSREEGFQIVPDVAPPESGEPPLLVVLEDTDGDGSIDSIRRFP